MQQVYQDQKAAVLRLLTAARRKTDTEPKHGLSDEYKQVINGLPLPYTTNLPTI